ncbi:MAG: phosphotransferase [Opitutales bacterium]
MALQFIKNLSGHSGCGIKLYKQDDTFIVRKDAGDKAYNRRLKKQYFKQNSFSCLSIKTPKLLNSGYIDDVFYFDMDFVQARTLSSIFQTIKINDIDTYIRLLFENLDVKIPAYTENAKAIFQTKIEELDVQIKDKSPLVENAFSSLKSFDFSRITPSNCHGDLTLENILLSASKEIYLIDFLDSFYDSWLIDVAKLLQDLELAWSYRYIEKDFNLNLRLSTAKGVLLAKIMSLPCGIEHLKSVYMLLLLNVVRIIPYAKDDVTKNFIEESIAKILTINKEFYL